MKNVCIIGSGQLGSRHLQALKAVKKPLNIFIIDTNEKALEIAKERYENFEAIGGNHNIFYNTGYESLPNSIEIAIIPTGSAPRKQCIDNLLSTAKVKFLVLEKLLFQTILEVETVGNLLEDNNVKTWINCPMRMIPFYEGLKQQFGGKPIYYQLSGSNFGLITNLIHYIDYMVYITGCQEFSLDLSKVNKRVVKSKREGYHELMGQIDVSFSDGSKGQFICLPEGPLALESQIFSEFHRVKINEAQGKASWSKWSDEKEYIEYYEEDISIPYQSQLTTILVEEILNKEKCRLPEYKESSQIHIAIMKPIIKFLNENTEFKGELFPFT